MSNITTNPLASVDIGKLDAFVGRRIAHPMMKRSLDKLLAMIRNPAGTEIALLCGPTGVGKTTLLNILVAELHRAELEAMKADPGYVPVVSVKAPAPKGANFSWKDFGIRVMDALEEPLMEHKVAPLQINGIKNARGNHNTLNADEVFRVTEQSLRFRKTKLLMVDEAQHMHHVTSGRRLLDQLDVLKSLSNGGSPIILLTGTYDLLNMFELNGQLLRRTTIINFPRYRYEGTEFQEFLVALKAFQSRLQTDKPTDLIQHAEFLYERCLGLVGILKNHLERALRRSLDRGAACVELEDLNETATDLSSLDQIYREIKDGEKKFHPVQDSSLLREALGMASKTPVISAPKPTRKVGLRKIINDPVGID